LDIDSASGAIPAGSSADAPSGSSGGQSSVITSLLPGWGIPMVRERSCVSRLASSNEVAIKQVVQFGTWKYHLTDQVSRVIPQTLSAIRSQYK
jgi:hypothetical protein